MRENRTFLHDLEDLKTQLEYALGYHEDGEAYKEDFCPEAVLKEAIRHTQDMINHALEIQLAIMKDDRKMKFYKERLGGNDV